MMPTTSVASVAPQPTRRIWLRCWCVPQVVALKGRVAGLIAALRRLPPRSSRPHRIATGITALSVLGTLVLALAGIAGAAETVPCPAGATLNVVAHPDDDLFFLSPDLLHDIAAGRCVRTVYVTAADDNSDASYWRGRERGAQAAYSQMAGARDSWARSDIRVAGHLIHLATLADRPSVSLVFMRLPDGFIKGGGGSRNGHESLQKLYTGAIPSIRTVDGQPGYSSAELTATLTALMTTFAPDTIRTLDFVGQFGDGDHSDHHAVAYFARAAQERYPAEHVFTGYQAYGIVHTAENVSVADGAAKESAFLAYAPKDASVCVVHQPPDWLARLQYHWRLALLVNLLCAALALYVARRTGALAWGQERPGVLVTAACLIGIALAIPPLAAWQATHVASGAELRRNCLEANGKFYLRQHPVASFAAGSSTLPNSP